MPSDDLILNVRQINGYPAAGAGQITDTILIQRGGLGGPYYSISAGSLIGNALTVGGEMTVGGQITAYSFQGGSAQLSNAAVGLLNAQKACVFELGITGRAVINGALVATQPFVNAIWANAVQSFNGRTGAVTLWINDILKAGGAPIWSPRLTGTPMADTPGQSSNSDRLATTAFVQRAIPMALDSLIHTRPFVFTFNGRTGDVVLTAEDITNATEGGGGAIFDNVILTGVPTAPTAAPLTSNNQLATTAFVHNVVAAANFAPLNSPVFTGYPQGPTASAGTATGQLATTAFVMAAVTSGVAGVASFNARTGAVVLQSTDIASAGGALLASPTFTGVPAAPTAASGVSTTQIATTAYVMNALGGAEGGVISFNGRAGAVTLTAGDITGAGGAILVSPAFTGNPTAPTQLATDSSTRIATTAFVDSVITAIDAGVVSFNGRSGIVTMTSADVSAAGGVTANSPAFTGTPTAPTPVPGDSSTQLATTAFVDNAMQGGGANTVQFSFVIPDRPAAALEYSVPITFPVTIVSLVNGAQAFVGTAPSASGSDTFQVNRVAGGTTTLLGTLNLFPSINWTDLALPATLAVGNVLQLIAPLTQDATLADVGVSILATRA